MNLEIGALDPAGRGVARNAGKVVFVEDALAGELVEARLLESRSKFDLARATEILRPSASRRAPLCPYFGVCGGCATQHVEATKRAPARSRCLEAYRGVIGSLRAKPIPASTHGKEWAYRHRARLSVRYVEGKGGALVGFRERKSTYVADMRSCEVLPPGISSLIVPLRNLIGSLSIKDRVPQIEIAAGENATVLLFRHLLPLTAADQDLLKAFAEANRVRIWLQPEGADSVRPFHPAAQDPLYYTLPEFGLKISFQPADFTQVNPAVNRLLVSRALRLLDPQPGERVADLFCGIGNFSLPIAARGAQVIGFEGSAPLVERARQNAAANGLTAQFEVADLFAPNLAHYGRFDKYLLDPPREGAVALVNALPEAWPRRIVYVSCDPATLARDAGILVNQKGFRLAAAGVVNMFPHTAHVESIALFDREASGASP